MTACVHPALAASRKNFCRKKRPGIPIFRAFFQTFSPIKKRVEDVEAVLNPPARKTDVIISTVVDLPSVPVTPMTTKLREGNRYASAARNASA